MARFSVQVSRHYGGYKGVGGQIGMHSFSEHDSMAHARTAATQFARKHPKDEILIYDNQTKRLTTVRAMPKQNPAGGIRAQVRRLASGQIQLKIPLKRGENALRKAHEVAKALGRKVVSVARAGSKTLNPGKAYWQYPWVVAVDSGSVGMTAALSRGFNTEAQAKSYIQHLKARSLHLGRAIQLLHNTGTNTPGGVKVVSSKSY